MTKIQMIKKKYIKDKNVTGKIPAPVENLERSFQLLKTILDLKLSLYRSLYPDQSVQDLEKRINREMVERKNKQWT